MFYLIFIFSSAGIVIVNNSLFDPLSPKPFLDVTMSVVVGAIAIFLLDAIVALLIRRCTPQSWYHPSRPLFKVSKKERNIYRTLKIKKWKSLVPELGLFTGFSKSKMTSTDDVEYLKKFIVESNYGVVIHIANALLGFLIAFIPICSAPEIWIPIYIVNFILSIAPVFILRYTSYTLLNLYKRKQRT